MGDLKTVIDRQNAAFEKHYAANDMEALKNLYTVDCRFMPPSSDTVIGNQVIPTAFGDMIKDGIASLNLVADEVGPLGAGTDAETVFERGHYKLSKADGSVATTGKYVVIWKKIEGEYKLYIDIFN